MLIFVLAVLFNSAKSEKSESVDIMLSSESDELSYSPQINTTIDSRGPIRQFLGIDYALAHDQLNMIACPVAAIIPLGKLILGVKKHSTLESEILRAIGLKIRAEVPNAFTTMVSGLKNFKGGNISLTSRIYLKRNERQLDERFKAKSEKIFQSTIQLLDLANTQEAADVLNYWTFEHTGFKINDTVEKHDLDGDNSKSLILISAIYFRGLWKNEFRVTEMQNFITQSGDKISRLFMMTRGYFNYIDSEELSAQILEIPYIGKDAALIVLLPKTNKGLSYLLRTLRGSPDLLNGALKNMKPLELVVKLPTFGILATVDLIKYYSQIGLKNMEFPYIDKHETLYISRAKQKMYFKVAINEVYGTGLESEHAIHMVRKNDLIDFPNFIVNHPFMFYVKINYDNFFTGVVYEP